MIKTDAIFVSILFIRLQDNGQPMKKMNKNCKSGSYDKNGELETFRYTQNQRRLEIRKKKYMKIIDKENKQTIINGKTIKEHETELSKHSCKTNNLTQFKEYLIMKNKLNINLFLHYAQNFFRKFKLNIIRKIILTYFF